MVCFSLFAPFASFAIPTITGELKRYFRDHGWMIRPPRRLQELRAQALSTRGDREQQLGRELTVSELAAQLGVRTGDAAQRHPARTGGRRH